MKLPDFSNLDLQNMGAWPMPLKAVLVVLLCILTQLAGYKFVLESQQIALSSEKSKEEKMRKELEEKAHKVVHLDHYKRKVENMKQTFGAMLRQLPDKNEVADLLVDISQSGLASGLEFELFKPEPEVKKGFYAELPIRIKVKGTYHEFGRFVSEVSGLSRIVTVHDFKISKEASSLKDKDKDKANQEASKEADFLVMESTAKTYRYLDEDEVDGSESAEGESAGSPKDDKAKAGAKIGAKKPARKAVKAKKG